MRAGGERTFATDAPMHPRVALVEDPRRVPPKRTRVPRHADERLRAALLDAILTSVLETGIAELSLRPLAAAVSSSPRTLLYHFGSKDGILRAVFAEAAQRQALLLDAWYARSTEYDTPTLLLRAWQWLVAPRHERLLRLLFEAHGIALRDRKRYGAFLRASANDWVVPFTHALEARGFPRERASALATLLVAVMRGLLLDVFATGERARVDRAFRSFVAAIEF